MPFAAAVKFKPDAFSKYFNPGEVPLAADDFCVIQDKELGAERVGFVSTLEGRAAVQMLHLPKVLRPATEREIERWYECKIQEKEMMRAARERAAELNLSIKLSDLVFIEEKRQAVIYFTSEQRIDFRELARDLGGRFKARIDMWQVGARKEAGMLGGMGICGQELCCSCWLKEFPTISMRHAKDQDIVQPPSKLSGPCGRLRCCLRYEHEAYVQMAAPMPAVGCTGCSSKGLKGVVSGRSILKGEITVQGEDGAYTPMPYTEFNPDPGQRAARTGRRDRPDDYDQGGDD